MSSELLLTMQICCVSNLFWLCCFLILGTGTESIYRNGLYWRGNRRPYFPAWHQEACYGCSSREAIQEVQTTLELSPFFSCWLFLYPTRITIIWCTWMCFIEYHFWLLRNRYIVNRSELYKMACNFQRRPGQCSDHKESWGMKKQNTLVALIE